MISRKCFKIIIFTCLLIYLIPLETLRKKLQLNNGIYILSITNTTLSTQSNKMDGISKVKIILFWNKPTYKRGNPPYGRKPFANCQYKNCFITEDRRSFSIDQVDLVVWRLRSEDKCIPVLKNPKTKLAFLMIESSSRFLTNQKAAEYNKTFHWTMNFRFDSDIVYKYGYLKQRPNKNLLTFTKDYSKNKTKMAAWFVSNCKNAPSQRNVLATTLAKYIKVDIYGSCGNLKCNKTANNCNEILENDYFFYLAFENSLCKDYITEKMYRTLKLNIIPVVYGLGPYRRYFPSNSYIDVFDFDSVEKLAQYLKYLTKNRTAYNEYFTWKSDFEVNTNGLGYYCNVCQAVNVRSEETNTYVDLVNRLITSSCDAEKDANVRKFITGSKIIRPYNDYLYKFIYTNATFLNKTVF